MKRINSLPEIDQEQVIAKYRGADLVKTSEQNDLLLLLLKAHCESRQITHVHDTAENRYTASNHIQLLSVPFLRFLKTRPNTTTLECCFLRILDMNF